jgi:hypothetical protein
MTTNPYAFRIHGRPVVRARGLTTDRWTAAHTEVTRFLGQCFAVGALLGLVVEMARPRKGERHG